MGGGGRGVLTNYLPNVLPIAVSSDCSIITNWINCYVRG